MVRRGLDPLAAAVALVWMAAVVVPPAALVAWRGARLAALDTPAMRDGWDEFRDDMRRQTGRDGPVQRKVPKSAEPPELVWLRDHTPLAVAAWVTLVGVLGGVLGMLVVGVARQRRLSVRGSAVPSRPPPGTGPA